MADVLVEVAVGHIDSLLTDEVKFLRGVKDKVERLKTELIMASSFLRDAESQTHNTREVIQNTISNVRNIAYEAEDIIEKYYIEVSQSRQEDGIMDCLNWLCCLPCDVKLLHEVGSDIDAFMEKLNDLTSQLQRYNIFRSSSKEEIFSWPPSSSSSNPILNRTFSFSEVDNTVGLVIDTQILVEQLVINQICSVISISGMGGIGKSTLAKKIFKHPDVNQHFKKYAWVYVSQQFQETEVLKSVLEKLHRNDKEEQERIRNLRDDMLHGELHKILQSHECLVVLDDIWHVGDWERLKPAFQSIRNSTSKLLITTRDGMLLSQPDSPVYIHDLQLLNDDDSWELFTRTALHTRDEVKERVGRDIVKKCGGLPLAIVTLSGILRGKEEKKWQEVLKNMRLHLNDGSTESKQYSLVTKVLELSYTDLPHHVRPCYLYMASFPEDYEIPVKRLWHLWEAETLLIRSSRDSEEIARDILNELIQRNLVQVDAVTKSGRIKTCHLHDMMRDMCMQKAKEENFFHVLEQDGLTEVGVNTGIRDTTIHRLAMHFGHDQSSTKSDYHHTVCDCGHVRSLIVCNSLPAELIKDMGKLYPLLRVLDLEGVRMSVFTKEIADFVHLRYLSLKNTGLKEVSPLIGKLRLLQTLDLRTSDFYEVILPLELFKMKRLVHLYFPSHYKCADGGKSTLSGLNNLETLINFNPYVLQPEDLHVMNKLKRISFLHEANNAFWSLESMKVALALASILSEKDLKKQFYVSINGNMLDKEPHMFEQFSNNKKIDLSKFQLNLKGVITRHLQHLVYPSSLSVLMIFMCNLEEDPMTKLKMLPSLKTLSIIGCSGLKKMECPQEGFPMLRILVLVGLTDLEEWEVEKGALPHLTHLCIRECDELRRKEVPVEVSTVMKGRISYQGEDSEQCSDSDMKELYKLCSELDAGEDITKVSSMIEEMLNKLLLSEKLSPADGKKILYWLLVSCEILADGTVKLRPGEEHSKYNDTFGIFKRWTWA